MNKEELHSIVEKQQPNICQIVCYKDNKNIYSFDRVDFIQEYLDK